MTNAFPRIRLATPDDRQPLIEIQRRASLAAATGEVARRLVEEPEHIDLDDVLLASRQVYLAEVGGVPVGYASIMSNDGDNVELDGMFVAPSHWRRGIGTLLIEAVERDLIARQARSLRVVAGANALGFYRSVGFSTIGEERTPLGPVALVMAKDIGA